MLISETFRKNSFLFVMSLSIVSLLFSKYFLSMTLIGMLTMLLFMQPARIGESAKIGFNRSLFQSVGQQSLWPFMGFVLYFFWTICSGIWSEDLGAWWHDVQAKSGILGLGLIFCFLPALSKAGVRFLHHVFYGTILISIVIVFVLYLSDYKDLTFRIGRGRPIPTPIDHVRYSIMVAYAALSSLALMVEADKRLNKLIYGLLAFVFVAAVHLLAVRTGIALLYAGLITLAVMFMIYFKRYRLGVLALVFVIAAPVVAYMTVPSFKKKLHYTMYDFDQYMAGKGTNYSDGDRIRSIQVGWDVWKENLLFGQGGGDYKAVVHQYYIDKQLAGKALLPHNQFVRSGLAYGLIGFALLFLSFVLIFLRKLAWKNILLILIAQTLFVSMLVESSLERYYGLVFFFLFLGINAQYVSDVSEE